MYLASDLASAEKSVISVARLHNLISAGTVDQCVFFFLQYRHIEVIETGQKNLRIITNCKKS